MVMGQGAVKTAWQALASCFTLYSAWGLGPPP